MAFQLDGTKILSTRCVAEGLDNGCHQIDFIGDKLHVVDTYQQRIIVYSPCFQEAKTYYPMPSAAYKSWDKGYVHCNSLLGVGKYILLLLHNGGKDTGRPSRVLVCNQALQPIHQFLLPGKGCHNLLVLEDGSLLVCNSLSGTLISHERKLVQVDNMMTRGLSVDQDQIVVGSSVYATRRNRIDIPGRVHFFNRDFERISTLELPAAPTDIRRIDGKDLSISNYAKSVTLTPASLAFLGAVAAAKLDTLC
ncbi:MAG: hypothetical protein Q7R66_14375 [Undibacterium sp.]|uniref:hypothetical protein n=1 Tax=Undibacterium sp. TaxID=1914977 RepID=UPI002727C1E1|nr:hypothetical protein [Undibacterium sp.]MDO8653368.1 hypothetical protein [Undibacterium sp.]